MQINITIEDIQQADIKEILEIQNENQLSQWTHRDYSEEIQRKDSIATAVKENNMIIGFAIARLITINFPNCHIQKEDIQNKKKENRQDEVKFEVESQIEIYNIVVNKNCRKEGIGSLLIQRIVQAAQTNHTSSIWLEVRASNTAAISFYKKNKFTEIYRRKNFYNHPLEDAVVMKLNMSGGGKTYGK